MIDTHTHLNFPKLAVDIEGVLERARAAGVTKFVVPGTTIEDSISGVNLSELHEGIFAAIGIHPTDARTFNQEARISFKELLEETNGVVSIGEVGLDYYHFEGLETPEAIAEYKDVQKSVFNEMITTAGEYALPLIIHSREAFADTHAMLGARSSSQDAVIHCFTGTADEAKGWLDINCMISLTAIITYKKNQALRDVIRDIPLDKIMLETDSPFLPPEGRRGEICEPMYVREVAQCLAEVKGLTLEEVDAITSQNAERFFGI